MTPQSSAVRSLASRLLEHETEAQANRERLTTSADTVCRTLSTCLEPLVGWPGVQVLRRRVLHMACSEYPLLESVKRVDAAINSDAWLEGSNRLLVLAIELRPFAAAPHDMASRS